MCFSRSLCGLMSEVVPRGGGGKRGGTGDKGQDKGQVLRVGFGADAFVGLLRWAPLCLP